MRLLLSVVLCLSLFGLSACESERHELHEARHNISFTVKMHHLHMLINHALQMAAQGADMNLHGSDHGPTMMNKASELLNRAMSGPEMARLHRGGHAKAALMKSTHDLADKSAALIEFMKTLSVHSKDKKAILMLNHAIEVAATGSSLIMLGQQGLGGDVDAVMVNHGQGMLGEASGLLHDVSGAEVYRVQVNEVVQMLIGIPDIHLDSDDKERL